MTCTEHRSDYNFEGLQNIYYQYKDPPFAQRNQEKTHTVLSKNEHLVTAIWMQIYTRTLICNSSTGQNTSEIWRWN